MKRKVLYSFCMLLLCMTACVDDEIRFFDELPKGETTVGVTVEFQSLTPALTTRAAAGNVVKNIESLCVLVYGLDGKLIEKYPIKWKQGQVSGYIEDEKIREGDTLAESKTPYARFNLKLPYGRYHMYAVANMGDLTTPSEVAEAIQTREGLKEYSLEWQEDVAKNNQMLGHFTEKGYYNDDVNGVTINRKNMELRAGIRRVVSKVTLAFDGSKLKEGVFVYIKSVRIKDIPRYCHLGNKNTVVKASSDSLIEQGDTIFYNASKLPFDESYPARVTKGRPYYPHDDKYNKDFHTETERALFFFENMQGVHEDNDKRQDADKNGIIDHPGTSEHPTPDYRPKDGILCGTYIEVEAYYRSINEERLGNGDIIYRFMLGKNVTTDYDAERNHHYKLTLCFKNFANDADWHIDYEEPEPSIQVPEPYYISYLYNHKMMFPVKVNTGNASLKSFTAEIDTNSWAPYAAPRLDYYRKLDPYDAQFNSDFNGGWGLRPWNGFLSLRRTKDKVIEANKKEDSEQKNKEYYITNRRGNRIYNLIPETDPTNDDEVDGKYYVTKQSAGETNFLLPMYTRAKQMIISSGYTGNNPYVAYQRKAVVEFTAKLSDGSTIVKHANIIQVRRVVNPKGIWRKWNSTRSFHVILKRLPMESATSFETFTSEGKWKAYTVIDPTGLVNLGTDTVKGSTGSPIDFTVGFNGICTDSTQNRCAIIRIEYHDYSCVHLIFVRQGSAPMELLSGKAKWLAGNMRTKTQETGCPLEEGSMFKFGRWDYPIDATNNVNDKEEWTNVQPGDFKDHKNTPFLIAGTNREVKWSAITPLDVNTKSFEDVTISLSNGKTRTLSVATIHDYEELYKSADIECAYGVLYGDDATETLTKIDEVYGHRYDKHRQGGGGYGMRGTFIYNVNQKDRTYGGRHLFFPIGASGYGHRKNTDGKWGGSGGAGTAVLRYAGGRYEQYDPEDQLKLRPLFYDLYMRPGAIYWAKQLVSQDFYSRYDDGDAIGWDFNYFTFDFNYISTTVKNDACFVRCVEK